MAKILLIEDESILSEMYRDKLLKAGFEVISSSEAENGFEVAKKEKPNLIVLDILLPKGDGISFLQKLREEPDISMIPVVVLSNYDDPATKKAALRLNVKEYIIKTNFTPQEIIDKIKKYIR